METRKMVLYYGLESEIIGVRMHYFDWEEGQILKKGESSISEAESTYIYAVFDGTEKNMMEILSMFLELNTATSMKGYNDVYVMDYISILDFLNCTPYTAKKKQWGDYNKRLDYMEEVVTNCLWS